MALPVYPAMTAAELELSEPPPGRCAWMACHFSSYGRGLSNLPRSLPTGSILILNDRIPVFGHDPELITHQLTEAVGSLDAAGVLLDLQRPGEAQTAAIVKALSESLPCPVAVSECYAQEASSAVFLDAPRAYHSLSGQVKKWQDRQLWLEVSFSPGTLTVTKDGSMYSPGVEFPEALPVHRDPGLHCSYCISKTDTQVQFHFYRTQEDLHALLEEAESLGITHAIGLHQELGEAFFPK